MPNATAAEWILALVTTAGRASSTTGDLLEEASGRGSWWFWSSVLRAAASHVWEDLCAARGRMLWLAFSGWLTMAIIGGGGGMLVILLWMRIWPYQVGPNSYYIPPWGFYGIMIAMMTAVPLLAGWDVAKRSQGRELAAGVALATLLAASGAVEALRSGTLVQRSANPYPFVQNTLVDFCVGALCVITGAMLRRLQARTSGRPATGPMPPECSQ